MERSISQKKSKVGESTCVPWWFRNSEDPISYKSVSSSGSYSNTGYNYTIGVCLGFCLRGPKEITDSWEEIFAAETDGSYSSKYMIGDYKPIDLGSEGVINMQIAGFDVDDKSDKTGKAPITWIGKELLTTTCRMNPGYVKNDNGTYQEGTGSVGGWEKCEMRNHLMTNVSPLIPTAIKSHIVQVEKTQEAFNERNEAFTQTTNDDIWIPSYEEVKSYTSLFINDSYLIKRMNDTKKEESWWTRSAVKVSVPASFTSVNASGALPGTSGKTSMGVCLCFCT